MPLIENIKSFFSKTEPLLSKEVKTQLISEMQAIRAQEGDIDGRVKGHIDREKQLSYTMELFKNQSDQDSESFKQKYEKNITSWINSSASRSRLVIIEAEIDTIEEIAFATFNASPIDRVVVAGLNEQTEESLKIELKKLWKNRLINSPENSRQLLGDENLDDWLESRSLDELLGPHLSKNNLDLRFETMKEEFNHFEVNIEEVLCFGTNDELVENLGDLSKNCNQGKGIPAFSVKSNSIKDDDHNSLWKSYCTDAKEFIKHITSGKSTPELIVIENAEGSHNIIPSPIFTELFQLPRMQKIMNLQGFSDLPLEQEDLDYFKNIFFHEALYTDNTSPEAITKTISKASSKLGAVKASTVAGSLWFNLIDMPISSGVEVDFAIGAMTLDGGNDLAKENLDKKNRYKLFFEDVLHTLVTHDVEKKEAIKIALSQTVNAYVNNEKQNKTITELVNGRLGAEAWRDLGLHSTNKVKKVNKRGLNILKVSPLLFFGGLALSFIPGGIIIPAVGLAILAVSTAVTAGSMHYQIRANKKYLPRANSALAEANKKMADADKERGALLARRLNSIKEKIATKDFEGLEQLNSETIPVNKIENTVEPNNDSRIRKILSFFSKKREIPVDVKQEMLDKLQAINEGNKLEVKGEVPKGEITREMKLRYTMDLFMNQANIAKLSSEEDYKKDITRWVESGPSRPRVVVLESTDDKKTMADIAKVTFNASPLENVLLAGLDSNRQALLKEELVGLWKERLENSQENRNQFEEIHRNELNQYLSLEELINSCDIKYLLGPHHYKEDLDLSYDSMQRRWPNFDVNVEEVLCYGSSSELAQHLGELGQKIQKGVPVFSVKSSDFIEGEDDHGLWKCSCENPEDFMKGITSGKSAPELIGANPEENYEKINISPTFKKLFNLQSFHEEFAFSENSEISGNSEVNDIEQADLNFFRKILFHEALYPANTSPERITQTISKATSKLGALAGIDVANSLIHNLYGNPKSTVVEIAYAISFMALDGGNDLVKESLDIKNIYKNFFEELRDSLIKKGEKPENATKLAFIKTIITYNNLEKNNPAIKKNTSDISGAKNWRDFGLDSANKARNVTRKGTKVLKVLKYLFLAGVVTGGIGLAFATGIAPAVAAAVVGYIGISSAAASILALFYSTSKIVKANKKYLPRANFAFAQANSKMFDCQKDRNTAIAKQLEVIKKELISNNNEQTISKVMSSLTTEERKEEETQQEINDYGFGYEFESEEPIKPNEYSLKDIRDGIPIDIKNSMPFDELNHEIKKQYIRKNLAHHILENELVATSNCFHDIMNERILDLDKTKNDNLEEEVIKAKGDLSNLMTAQNKSKKKKNSLSKTKEKVTHEKVRLTV